MVRLLTQVWCSAVTASLSWGQRPRENRTVFSIAECRAGTDPDATEGRDTSSLPRFGMRRNSGADRLSWRTHGNFGPKKMQPLCETGVHSSDTVAMTAVPTAELSRGPRGSLLTGGVAGRTSCLQCEEMPDEQAHGLLRLHRPRAWPRHSKRAGPRLLTDRFTPIGRRCENEEADRAGIAPWRKPMCRTRSRFASFVLNKQPGNHSRTSGIRGSVCHLPATGNLSPRRPEAGFDPGSFLEGAACGDAMRREARKSPDARRRVPNPATPHVRCSRIQCWFTPSPSDGSPSRS